jgi:antitoxin VapB
MCYISRVGYPAPPTGLADLLLAIGQDTALRLHEPFRTADHGDLLYDERGLPA